MKSFLTKLALTMVFCSASNAFASLEKIEGFQFQQPYIKAFGEIATKKLQKQPTIILTTLI